MLRGRCVLNGGLRGESWRPKLWHRSCFSALSLEEFIVLNSLGVGTITRELSGYVMSNLLGSVGIKHAHVRELNPTDALGCLHHCSLFSEVQKHFQDIWLKTLYSKETDSLCFPQFLHVLYCVSLLKYYCL